MGSVWGEIVLLNQFVILSQIKRGAQSRKPEMKLFFVYSMSVPFSCRDFILSNQAFLGELLLLDSRHISVCCYLHNLNILFKGILGIEATQIRSRHMPSTCGGPRTQNASRKWVVATLILGRQISLSECGVDWREGIVRWYGMLMVFKIRLKALGDGWEEVPLFYFFHLSTICLFA